MTTPATTPAAPLTAAEFLKLPDNGQLMELVKGVVIEMPPPTPRHGEVCMNSGYLVRRFLDDRPTGRVVSNDAAIITERTPDTVRGADIAYYSYERVPQGEMPIGYIDVAPDMVIEVRSPSERWSAILKKVFEYLEAGVTLVCVLDIQTKTAVVCLANQLPRTVAADDELDLSEVLPGFRVPLRRFFE
jgi:Uma2 family endonuclease